MIEKKISVVQVYIHLTKGVEVSINIRNSRDLQLLEMAYMIASSWMSSNNVKFV